MKSATRVALAAFSCLALSEAFSQDVQDKRWSGWCEYRGLPGEQFPAPRLNLPEWACIAAAEANLHRRFAVHSRVNPFFLLGDFNGDGRQDLALWVAELKTKKLGLIVLHQGHARATVLAAGRQWDRRTDNFSGLDMWTIQPKGTTLESIHEDGKKVLLRSDALVVTKSESASFSIYWDGKAYVSYQLSD